MNLEKLAIAEQNAWLRYQEAQAMADRLNAEWSIAFSAYREEFNATPISACEWLRREGVDMWRPV